MISFKIVLQTRLFGGKNEVVHVAGLKNVCLKYDL